MPTPSSGIIALLSHFAIAFTAPTFAHVLVLVYGAILAPGRRRVAVALRATGHADEQHFTSYYRVLNRAEGSPWVLSQILLGLIIQLCLSPEAPLVLIIDETLERRRGQRIKNLPFMVIPARSPRTTQKLGKRSLLILLAIQPDLAKVQKHKTRQVAKNLSGLVLP